MNETLLARELTTHRHWWCSSTSANLPILQMHQLKQSKLVDMFNMWNWEINISKKHPQAPVAPAFLLVTTWILTSWSVVAVEPSSIGSSDGPTSLFTRLRKNHQKPSESVQCPALRGAPTRACIDLVESSPRNSSQKVPVETVEKWPGEGKEWSYDSATPMLRQPQAA